PSMSRIASKWTTDTSRQPTSPMRLVVMSPHSWPSSADVDGRHFTGSAPAGKRGPGGAPGTARPLRAMPEGRPGGCAPECMEIHDTAGIRLSDNHFQRYDLQRCSTSSCRIGYC